MDFSTCGIIWSVFQNAIVNHTGITDLMHTVLLYSKTKKLTNLTNNGIYISLTEIVYIYYIHRNQF